MSVLLGKKGSGNNVYAEMFSMVAEINKPRESYLKDPSWLLLAMIVGYTMLFEWRGVFELSNYVFAANFLKTFIPVSCALFVISTKLPFKHAAAKRYVVVFFVFLLWGLFSCLFSSELSESLVQWVKYLYRLFFCFFICLYLIESEQTVERLMKFLVAIAVLTVIQYIFLEISDFNSLSAGFILPTPRGGVYHGPYGILGHGWARVHFQNISFYRLYGFWLEPSTASGFLLASAFFSEALYVKTKQKIWRIGGVLCFLGGGVATFSNTAYLAVGAAGLLEEAFWVKTGKHTRQHLFKVIFFVFVILTAIFGRYFVAKYYSDNKDLRYLIGVRESVQDPYGGRFSAVKANIAAVSGSAREALCGIGFRVPVKDTPFSSASAPIQWFIFTGTIGILLLGFREFQLMGEIYKNVFSSIYVLRVSQAWLVAFISNLIYGDLMGPFYFITVAIVFSYVCRSKLGTARYV